MRRLLCFTLLIASAVFAFAENAPAPLVLSKCDIAIKVTDPQKQLTHYGALLKAIDGIQAIVMPKEKKVSRFTKEALDSITKVPGVDAKGDYWFVLLPPPSEGSSDDPAMSDENFDLEKLAEYAIVMLVPLTDPQPMRALAASKDPANKLPIAQVFDHYALFNLNQQPMPTYSDVTADIKLVSSCDIVAAFASYTMLHNISSGNDVPEEAQAVIKDLFKEMKENVQRYEIGLDLKDGNYSLEGIVIPIADSPMNKQLAATKDSTLPITLAGYLPPNLACCLSNSAEITGAPNVDYFVPRSAMEIISDSMLTPARSKALSERYETLLAQCSQGRAIGVTVPTFNTDESAVLVAAYHVADAAAAREAFQHFLQEAMRSRDSIAKGQFKNVVKIFYKPLFETTEEIPVDLMRIIINSEDFYYTGKVMSLECHLAFTDNTMFITAGNGSRTQIFDMVHRLKTGQSGFTASEQFQSIKAGIPANLLGFATLMPVDAVRSAMSIVPDRDAQIIGGAVLNVYPQQHTPINIIQEARDGALVSRLTFPREQAQLIGSIIESVTTVATHYIKESTIHNNFRTLQGAVMRFKRDTGVYPYSLQELIAPKGGAPKGADGKPVAKKRYKGPYLHETDDGIGDTVFPRNPYVDPEDTDVAHHWTYNRKNGKVKPLNYDEPLYYYDYGMYY